MNMKKTIITALLALVAMTLTLLTSCTIVRGYKADGAYGPTSFSYQKQQKDTVVNRSDAFTFHRATQQCDWIDTLHFFNQGKRYKNTTLWDAIREKTETQGVLIIENDSIVYEKCMGDMTADRIAGVFSVTKSVTSLLCGIAVDEGYIKSVDDAVTDYLPELKKKNQLWQKLTIRHLLDMRSGLDFDDTYSLSIKPKKFKRLHAMARLNYGHNIPKQIRKLKFRNEPGSVRKHDDRGAWRNSRKGHRPKLRGLPLRESLDTAWHGVTCIYFLRQQEAPHSPCFRRSCLDDARPCQNRPSVSEPGRMEREEDCERVVD